MKMMRKERTKRSLRKWPGPPTQDWPEFARQIFERGGYANGREPNGVGELASRFFRCTYAPPRQKDHARLVDEATISYRRDSPDADCAVAIARCIALWAIRDRSFEVTREAVDELAVFLLVPPKTLGRTLKRYGLNIAALAYYFVCPAWVIRRALRDALARRGEYAMLSRVAEPKVADLTAFRSRRAEGRPALAEAPATVPGTVIDLAKWRRRAQRKGTK
jgi:hypothetical protein